MLRALIVLLGTAKMLVVAANFEANFKLEWSFRCNGPVESENGEVSWKAIFLCNKCRHCWLMYADDQVRAMRFQLTGNDTWLMNIMPHSSTNISVREWQLNKTYVESVFKSKKMTPLPHLGGEDHFGCIREFEKEVIDMSSGQKTMLSVTQDGIEMGKELQRNLKMKHYHITKEERGKLMKRFIDTVFEKHETGRHFAFALIVNKEVKVIDKVVDP